MGKSTKKSTERVKRKRVDSKEITPAKPRVKESSSDDSSSDEDMVPSKKQLVTTSKSAIVGAPAKKGKLSSSSESSDDSDEDTKMAESNLSKGSVWWTAEERPVDNGRFRNGIGCFKNTGEPMKISVARYEDYEREEAENLVVRLSCHDSRRISKIIHTQHQEGVTTVVLDRLGLVYDRWIYQPNVKRWVVDDRGTIIGPGQDFLTVFNGIIIALDEFVWKEGYHGNLLNAVSVLENMDVKLCWPTECKIDVAEGLRKDLQEFKALVGLAAAAESRVTFHVGIGLREGWGNCITLFWEMITELIPKCKTHADLKNLWFSIKNHPLFQNADGRYNMVRQFDGLNKDWSVCLHVNLSKAPTDMRSWHSKVKLSGALTKITWADASNDPGWSLFKFHRDAHKHVKDHSEYAMMSHTDVSEELFNVFPEFLPNYYYRLVQEIYRHVDLGIIKMDDLIRLWQQHGPRALV